MVIQLFVPVFDRGPGYIKPRRAVADDTLSAPADQQPVDFASPERPQPFQFPASATSLTDLLPFDRQSLPIERSRADHGQTRYRVNVPVTGGAALVDEQVLFVFEPNAFDTAIVVQIDGLPTPPVSAPPRYSTWLPVVYGVPRSGLLPSAGGTGVPEAAQPGGRSLTTTTPLTDDTVYDGPIFDIPFPDPLPMEPSVIVTDAIDLPGALDGPTTQALTFDLQLIDLVSGQPITTTVTGIHMAVDARPYVPPGAHIWATTLQPLAADGAVDAAAGVSAIPVQAHDPAGIISMYLAEFDEGAAWQVAIATVGSGEETPAGRSGAVQAPKAWVPGFNAPTVSGFSGAATYQYPITLPPGRGGLTPNIDIGYSSGALRGLTVNKHLDQGLLGLGWSMNSIEITRDLIDIKPVGGIGFENVFDIVHVDRFSLVINGASYQLLPIGTQTDGSIQRDYRAVGNPSIRVRFQREMGTTPTSEFDYNDGLYWTVTTPDGTVYRLGYTVDSVAYHLLTGREIAHIQDGGHATWRGRRGDLSAYRWKVDTVTDVNGNQAQYDYYTWEVDGGPNYRVYTTMLDTIYYNFAATASSHSQRLPRTAGSFATKVVFERENVTHPSIGDTYKLVKAIRVYHLDMNAPIRKVEFVREVYARENLIGETPNACVTNPGTNATTFWQQPSVSVNILQINSFGWNNAAEPGVKFDYITKGHGADSYGACFQFRYLGGVRSETGGYTRFVYSHDGRGEIVQNGYVTDCGCNILWRYTGINQNTTIVRSYFVIQVEQYDGIQAWRANYSAGILPTSGAVYGVTKYDYRNPCYDFRSNDPADLGSGNTYSADPLICKSRKPYADFDYGVGKLTGFANVTVTSGQETSVASGSPPFEIFGTSKSVFGRQGFYTTTGSNPVDMYDQLLRLGKPTRETLLNAGGVLLTEKTTAYADILTASPYFVAPTQECTTSYAGYNTNAAAMQASTQCVEISYETSRQGNAQYGNVTQITQSGNLGGQPETRTTIRLYTINPTAWIVNRVGTETLHSNATLGTSGFIERTTNFYDGNTSSTAQPSKGLLTKQRQHTTVDDFIETTVAYDAYGNPTVQTDPRGNATTTTYDPTHNLYPVTISTPINENENHNYVQQLNYRFLNAPHNDGPPGTLRGHKQVNGLWLYYWFDDRGRLETTFRGWAEQGSNNNSPSTEHAYYDGVVNANGKLTEPLWTATWTKTQDNALKWTAGGTRQVEIFDALARVIQTQTADTNWQPGSGNLIIVDTTYNARGDVLRQSVPYRTANHTDPNIFNLYKTPDLSQPAVTSRYDAAGQPVWQSDPLGNTSATISGRLATYGRDGRDYLQSRFFDDVGQLIAVDEALAVTVDDAAITTTGIGSNWNTIYSLPLTAAPHAATAFQTTFVAQPAGSALNAFIYMHTGTWAQSSYQRWGIQLTGSQLTVNHYANGQQAAYPLLLNIEYGAEYQLYVRSAPAGNTTDEWIILVWKVEDPSVRAEYRIANATTNSESSTWQFAVQIKDGSITTSDYRGYQLARTRYQYDLQGNLTKVTNALGHETTMDYDMLGRKTRMDDPDMGVWTYAYDAAGNLIAQTGPVNGTLYFTYDNLNRLTSKRINSAAGARVAAYTYYNGGVGKGQRATAESFDGPSVSFAKATWTYDSLGRVTSETRVTQNNAAVAGAVATNNSFAFTYTQGDLPRSVTYPDGETVTTDYYWVAGAPRGMTSTLNGTTVSLVQPGASYTAAGQLAAVTLGNNRQITYTYDNAQRLTTITTPGDSNLLPDQTYAYDGNSNITDWDVAWKNVGEISVIQQERTFKYDSLNRLIRATVTDGPAESQYDEAVVYDPLGNIAKKGSEDYGYGQTTGIRSSGANVHIHAVTHIDGQPLFSYDAAGNMSTRTTTDAQNVTRTWTHTWTRENMLQQATSGSLSVRFAYDADNQQVMRIENAGTKATVILGDGLYEREYLNGTPGTITKRYLFGGQAIGQKQGSQTTFFLNDHLGGLLATMSGAVGGAVHSIILRDAWGKQVHKTGTAPIGTAYLYTGQRWDELLGLYNYNARWYDPGTGRFVSADTVVPDEGDPQAYSRYTYVLNRPLQLVDPSGHVPATEGGSSPNSGDDEEEDSLTVSHDRSGSISGASPTGIGFPEGGNGTDFTGWLLDQMLVNANSQIVQDIRELNAGTMEGWFRSGAAGVFEARAATYTTFMAQVNYGMPWDFKTMFNQRGISCVELADRHFRMDIVANIHYGFIGRACGFSRLELLAAAGLAQQAGGDSDMGRWWAWGDEPADAEAIKLGMNLYDWCGSELTIEQLSFWIQHFADSGAFAGYTCPDYCAVPSVKR